MEQNACIIKPFLLLVKDTLSQVIFNDTLILAIFASTDLAYIHFSNFNENYKILANTSIHPSIHPYK